jgi:hypothetical protein
MTGQIYHIRIRGHLDTHWASWFEDLTIHHAANGESLLTGCMHDQAALFGNLMKIRDLGLTLISVQPAEHELNSEGYRKESCDE